MEAVKLVLFIVCYRWRAVSSGAEPPHRLTPHAPSPHTPCSYCTRTHSSPPQPHPSRIVPAHTCRIFIPGLATHFLSIQTASCVVPDTRLRPLKGARPWRGAASARWPSTTSQRGITPLTTPSHATST